jgi:predicted DNA binding CopG/RHH family protein
VKGFVTTISGKEIRRVNISLSSYWHRVGKNTAVSTGLSFSSYLEQLIYQDSLHNKSG